MSTQDVKARKAREKKKAPEEDTEAVQATRLKKQSKAREKNKVPEEDIEAAATPLKKQDQRPLDSTKKIPKVTAKAKEKTKQIPATPLERRGGSAFALMSRK